MTLLAQRDPRARSAVVEVRRVTPRDGRFHALTDDTPLYPEGGGQPRDHGTLAGREVLDVSRTPEGPVHVLAEPVALGPAEAVVDWARRWDHMQQHTAQHLLTAVLQDAFGWATTSFHLHPGLAATCDVELAGDVPADALPALEERVAAELRAARRVSVEECLPDALAGLGVRTRGLPAGHEGPVRLVRIDGLDLNTCGGTHVASTAELEAVALLGVERLRGGTRLSFVAGGRVRAHLREAVAGLRAAAALLSRPPREVPEGVERLLAEQKALVQLRDSLGAELAEVAAAGLAPGPGVRHLHRAAGDLPWANAVAARATSAEPALRLLVTVGPDDDAGFVLAGPAPWVAEVKAGLLAALGARGGGPPGRLQGKGIRRAAAVAWLAGNDG